ncbi:hypothetical protein [Streptomyces erythrochromogenes]|uniref:hypothetical protein n=1 Tax=Streptomyces erythrochromogenes TaxID=285574 RepID=UPI0038B5C2AC
MTDAGRFPPWAAYPFPDASVTSSAAAPAPVPLGSRFKVLRASGYGMATQQLSATIDTARLRLEVPPGNGADAVRLRYADRVSALPACEAVYAEAVAERPGMPARRPGWDRGTVLAPQGGRDGGSRTAGPQPLRLASPPPGDCQARTASSSAPRTRASAAALCSAVGLPGVPVTPTTTLATASVPFFCMCRFT